MVRREWLLAELKMNSIIIGLVVTMFLGAIAFGAFMVKRELDKTNPEKSDTSLGGQITTAQEFLPFKTIKDNVIDLGNHDYRMIIECSSVNYDLRTDKEKEIIELSFQRMVNAISHPVTFFIQTKTMDNTTMLEKMQVEIEDLVKEHPQMEEYARNYYGEMQQLSEHIGNNKQKKKYIIVPFNEAVALEKLNESDKYDYSLTEIKDRCVRIMDGLSPMGIKAHILNTNELIELVYNSYHKDNHTHFKNLASGEFLTPIVKGENKAQNLTDDMKMDWILYEAQMRIREEITSKKIPEYMLKDYESVIKDLNELRDSVGGHFKS